MPVPRHRLVPALATIATLHVAPAWSVDLESLNIQADSVHSNGKTALMQAARAGDMSEVENLIRIGADVHRTNRNGGTTLMYAVLGGDLETVRLLIQSGVNIDAVANNGWSAVMIAAAKGRPGALRELLVRSADPNIPDIYGWTPLMRAVHEKREAAVQLLLEDPRTKVNHRGENGITALHIATVMSYAGIAKMLLNHGADRNLRDESGRTAYEVALQKDDLELMDLLN